MSSSTTLAHFKNQEMSCLFVLVQLIRTEVLIIGCIFNWYTAKMIFQSIT
jgi:hypothetical protein